MGLCEQGYFCKLITWKPNCLLDGMQHTEPPLRSVLHSAGVLSDALIDRQTLQGIMAVMAPKIGALSCLRSFIRATPLSALSLFSSVSAVVGNAGQSNYAAANAGLDANAYSMQVEQAMKAPPPLPLFMDILDQALAQKDG
jgi:KR domain